jgi:hypothetical protein
MLHPALILLLYILLVVCPYVVTAATYYDKIH